MENLKLEERLNKNQKKKSEPCGAYRATELDDSAFAKALGSLQAQSRNPFLKYLRSSLRREEPSNTDFPFLITSQGAVSRNADFPCKCNKVSLPGHEIKLDSRAWITKWHRPGPTQMEAWWIFFLKKIWLQWSSSNVNIGILSLQSRFLSLDYASLGTWDARL